jgi:mitochondrial fission protein ELM1
MHLLILSDGKKGHENQSLGLAEAILRRREGTYELSSIQTKAIGCQEREKADLILAAGHRTHPFLLNLARRYSCPSVVIMKPSLPRFLFGHCLIPEHDLKTGKRVASNTTATRGALNRIPEDIPIKEKKGLMMLGGPSKHFDWDSQAIIEAIEKIVTSHPEFTWTVGDSRRTPEGLLAKLSNQELPLLTASHHEATGSWLTEQLLSSEVAWISPDSTSMLFEALTAGCRLGTLPLPARQTRLSRAHDLLARDHWLTPFTKYDPTVGLSAPPAILHETARCADVLLEKFFPSSFS